MVPADLIDAVVRLVPLLDRPRDRIVPAPLYVREILGRLVTGEQGVTIREPGLADTGLTHIARAVRYEPHPVPEAHPVAEGAPAAGHEPR